MDDWQRRNWQSRIVAAHTKDVFRMASIPDVDLLVPSDETLKCNAYAAALWNQFAKWGLNASQAMAILRKMLSDMESKLDRIKAQAVVTYDEKLVIYPTCHSTFCGSDS